MDMHFYEWREYSTVPASAFLLIHDWRDYEWHEYSTAVTGARRTFLIGSDCGEAKARLGIK